MGVIKSADLGGVHPQESHGDGVGRSFFDESKSVPIKNNVNDSSFLDWDVEVAVLGQVKVVSGCT